MVYTQWANSTTAKKAYDNLNWKIEDMDWAINRMREYSYGYDFGASIDKCSCCGEHHKNQEKDFLGRCQKKREKLYKAFSVLYWERKIKQKKICLKK